MDTLAWNVGKKEEEIQLIVMAIKTLTERYTQEKDVSVSSRFILANRTISLYLHSRIGPNGASNPAVQDEN
jgi:hypothetical protein